MVFAAKLSEVPNWGKKVVTLNGQEILLVNTKGQIYACEPTCPHQDAPLSGALLKEAGFLSCQRHGYKFNLASGECKEAPHFTLKVYPVELSGEDIMVEI